MSKKQIPHPSLVDLCIDRVASNIERYVWLLYIVLTCSDEYPDLVDPMIL